MPAELKPSPRCCCVLGTETHVATIGAGHDVVIGGYSLHGGIVEQHMFAPTHALRYARQLLEAVRRCGKDVPEWILESAALERRRLEPKHGYEKPLPTIEYVGRVSPARAPAVPHLRVLPEQRPLRAGLTAEQIESAWARFRAGEAPVHILAQELGCSDIAVRHAFERTHGGEFMLIRGCYRGGRMGPPLKREIDRLLSGERQPVVKPSGQLL